MYVCRDFGVNNISTTVTDAVEDRYAANDQVRRRMLLQDNNKTVFSIFFQLGRLENLWLDVNKLSGILPSESFQGLVSLKTLDIRYNNIYIDLVSLPSNVTVISRRLLLDLVSTTEAFNDMNEKMMPPHLCKDARHAICNAENSHHLFWR